MKKIILALCLLLFCVTPVFAEIEVDYDDIYTFKTDFADCLVNEVNETELTDSDLYEFIILSLDESLNSYASYPVYINSLYDGEETDLTLESGNKYLQETAIKNIHAIGKKRFLKAIYNKVSGIDLSETSDPDWMFTSVNFGDGEVAYILEMDFSSSDVESVEETFLEMLGKTINGEDVFIEATDLSEYMVTVATYVEEFDELVIDIIFIDAEGAIIAETVLVQNGILE